jgi:hypothetical protein
VSGSFGLGSENVFAEQSGPEKDEWRARQNLAAGGQD